MPIAPKIKRGRPTGSGIDDRIWLRELKRLLQLNPQSTPTTAIKALGITDTSTIRRLREKYKRLNPADARAPQHAEPQGEAVSRVY